MITVSMRRTLVALATAAALVPAAPALAQTATPTATLNPAPTPAAPRIEVDRTSIDHGQTMHLVVFGRVGATARVFGNGRLIREAVLELTEQDAIGIAVFNLQPGDRTLFHATVDGRQTASATVQVRRTVTIGVSQANGIYTFTGTTRRAEAGLQVTVARLDAVTKRVAGVASARTNAAGNYTIRTRLPVGQAGYYALTGVTSAGALQPGRSRLYGLVVPRPPVPKVTGRVSIAPVDIDPFEGWYVLYGNIGPCVQDKIVNIYRESNGRRSLIARTRADCSDGAPHWGIAYSPGTLSGVQTYLAGIDGDARITAAMSNRVRYDMPRGGQGPEGQYAAGANGFSIVGPNYISG